MKIWRSADVHSWEASSLLASAAGVGFK